MRPVFRDNFRRVGGALAGDGMLRDSSQWRARLRATMVASPSLQVHARTLFRRVDRGAVTSRVSEPLERVREKERDREWQREPRRGRQDLITFCRAAGWKLAQLHDVDVVPCYHVNGRLNVLGRDKRVCSPGYVARTSSVPSIQASLESRSGILSLDVVVG